MHCSRRSSSVFQNLLVELVRQEDAPEGIVFDRTGKKKFVVGTGGQEINQYNL